MEPKSHHRSRALPAAVGLLIALLVAASSQATDTSTLLQRYVEHDDDAYDVQVAHTHEVPEAAETPAYDAYLVRLAWQHWRSPSEVNRTLWKHALTVVVPSNLQSTTSLLFVLGGDNDDDYLRLSASDVELLHRFAVATGSIVSAIRQVPNQPLVFADEPHLELEEDALVAYSWDTAMGTGDYTWAAYLPMTKAVVKAMDAIQDVAGQISQATVPKEFVVAGFSKRAAATWLTATVDGRVKAIAPGVFDALNFAPSSENQRRVYGEPQEPLADYTQRKVLDRLRIAEGRRLLEVVDPYSYLRQLDLPKYLINATGDEFFPPDSWRFYLSDLPGETLIRYIPNTSHGGDNGGEEKAYLGLLAWYQRILAGASRPQISWHYEEHTGEVSVASDVTPEAATLWVATNTNARDFRHDSIGAAWDGQTLEADAPGVYSATVSSPAAGWTALTVELMYGGVAGVPEIYSTPVFITPDTYAHELEQTVQHPRSLRYWRRHIHAVAGSVSVDTELARAFPLRLLGSDYIQSIHAASDLLSHHRGGLYRFALQECLATRLNINTDRLGWYSRPQSHFDGRVYSWQIWNAADWLYRVGAPFFATGLCRALN